MIIVVQDCDAGLVMRQPGLLTRLAAWLLSPRLDRELAAGASPDEGEWRALRAYFLVRPAVRRQLALRLANVVDEATGLGAEHPLGVPVRRRVVREAADLIRALIDRLTMPAPVPARGMALVHQLLTDGSGPLYAPTSPEPLEMAIRQALDALDPLTAWS
jgi:hypothetical protein